MAARLVEKASVRVARLIRGLPVSTPLISYGKLQSKGSAKKFTEIIHFFNCNKTSLEVGSISLT